MNVDYTEWSWNREVSCLEEFDWSFDVGISPRKKIRWSILKRQYNRVDSIYVRLTIGCSIRAITVAITTIINHSFTSSTCFADCIWFHLIRFRSWDQIRQRSRLICYWWRKPPESNIIWCKEERENANLMGLSLW